VCVLAISTARRVSGGPFAGVPTLSEQGIDVVSGGWRAVLGPKGLTESQIAFWESTFGKLTATTEWQQELESSDATNEYLNSADTRRFLAQQLTQIKDLMTGLGLAKQ
jgi:putative tricarboxylic transport membrane protein